MAHVIMSYTRKYKYHVITPVARFQNLTPLIKMLATQNVKWHVIVDEENLWYPVWGPMSGPNWWISTYTCPNDAVGFWQRCNTAINWFLDKYPLIEDERYCFLNDDDAYEPGFFDAVDRHDGDVLICSMERGNRTPADAIPERRHGAEKLIAAPQNMTPGAVGVEQIIMSGKILKNVRIPLALDGDGRMIQWVVNNYGAEYVPEASVWFNYLEPGRWDK